MVLRVPLDELRKSGPRCGTAELTATPSRGCFDFLRARQGYTKAVTGLELIGYYLASMQASSYP